MTDNADAIAGEPDPDDHVARLRAEIDAVKARRANYRSEAAETVARGGPAHATDAEAGIVKTDDTIGKIAADASQEIGNSLSRARSRLRRGPEDVAGGSHSPSTSPARQWKSRESKPGSDPVVRPASPYR